MDQMTGERKAFTLVELLVVMAIIILLSSVAIPALNSVAMGSNLNRAGQIIGDQIALARQEAVTKNREVQVRFYDVATNQSWRGVQIWRVEQTSTGAVNTPVSRLATLPEGIVINSDASLSPLLTADGTMSSVSNSPPYRGFRFRANGATDSSITAANGYITLQQATAQGNPPANYYTVQINPMTGKVMVYRP